MRILLALVLLVGCSTPAEVRDVEEAQQTSHERAILADSIVVEALADGYRDLARTTAEGNLIDDMKDPENQEVLMVPVVPAPGEDGRIDPADIEVREVRILRPEMAIDLARDYVGFLDETEGNLSELLSNWRAARDGNLENHDRLRTFLRERWYDRPGFGPDEIRAIGRGIESEIP